MARFAVALALFCIVPSSAYAQFACGAAVEQGKYEINTCIETNMPACRTRENLDRVWAQALASSYVQSLGGCTDRGNLLDAIYWDGSYAPMPPPVATHFEDPYAPANVDSVDEAPPLPVYNKKKSGGGNFTGIR